MTTYLMTMETVVIFDIINCKHLINKLDKLYITEDHCNMLKDRNKEYNLSYDVISLICK